MPPDPPRAMPHPCPPEPERPGPHRLGSWGERVAAEYLEERGWTVLARNFRLGRNEVDLVAARAGIVAFVEVKTRSGCGYGAPEEAVTARKRREIEAVATGWLQRHDPGRAEVRFDVVGIVVDERRVVVRLTHTEDAWRPRGWSG